MGVLKAYSILDDSIHSNTEKVIRQSESFLTCAEETTKTFESLAESLTELNDTHLPLEVQNNIIKKATDSTQEAQNALENIKNQVQVEKDRKHMLVAKLKN